jgi:hypothetical protein
MAAHSPQKDTIMLHLITLVLIVLKLSGAIKLHWGLVLSPSIVAFLFFFGMTL